MVKVRVGEHAKINKKLIKLAINSFFGKTLIHRVYTRTLDAFGQIASISYVNVSFIGDLQVYPNIVKAFIEVGIINNGEGILYIHPDALTPRPRPEDVIVDGTAFWEVMQEIEAPTLNGVTCHYSYKVRRQVDSNAN